MTSFARCPPFFPAHGEKLAVVLDTDTFNEVDDQFALAHLLLAPERIDLQAVYAAPFFNKHSSGPADGMEKSFEEIHRILEVIGAAPNPAVFRGSPCYLPAAGTPVASDAVTDLVSSAMAIAVAYGCAVRNRPMTMSPGESGRR